MTEAIVQIENLSKMYRIRPSDSLGWWRNRRILTQDIASLIKPFRNGITIEKKVDFWALKNISFDAHRGDVIGVIGRNGAGKSTLLKILGRVTEPTSGRAIIAGRVGSLLEVGTGFHSELTGRENIFVSGAILGMPRSEIKRKFDEIVAFSGVEEFLETPVKRFSSGMEVRLAFSIAVHLNPSVLLIDEVLSVGDASFREKSLQKIKDVSDNGSTILFVSHNMTTVSSLCNKAIVLDHGQISFPVGSVQAAIEHYLSMVKASTQVNLDAGRRGRKPGAIEITDFGAYDTSGTLLETLTSGTPLNFIIDYKKNTAKPEKHICFEILLKTLNGEIIANLNSQNQIGTLTLNRDKGKIICHIEKLPLAAGTITTSVRVLQNQIMVDQIEDVFISNVDTGGHYR